MNLTRPLYARALAAVTAVVLAGCATPDEAPMVTGLAATTPMLATFADDAPHDLAPLDATVAELDAAVPLMLEAIAARDADARDAAARRARSARTVRAAAPASGDVWTRLAACESGGNPRAVSPTGKYRGYLQFSVSSWVAVGFSGDPIDHPVEVQIEAGRRLQRIQGWGAWPTCARRLGLV